MTGVRQKREHSMSDLFSSVTDLAAPLPIPDADIRLRHDALSPVESATAFRSLQRETQWREEEIIVWGKRYKQPRLIAWHGDEGAGYSYSGSKLRPSAWTGTLMSLRAIVERLTGRAFNSVLLNYYRCGRDSMGWHSDDEPELGRNPFIASLSLGEERVLQFRHRTRTDLPIQSLTLTDGSLLLMAGPTQTFWRHCIRKESRPHNGRINLTFRTIYPIRKDTPR